MRRKHNTALTPKARALRKNMTSQERKLWYEFLRTYPVRVLRQKVIGKYVVDFYCAKAKLVIELEARGRSDASFNLEIRESSRCSDLRPVI